MTTDMDRFHRTLEDGVSGELEGYVDEITKSIVATVWNACDDERGRLATENARLEGVIAKQAADKDDLKSGAREFEARNAVLESQLHTVDQKWGAIHAAVHDWEMGHADPAEALRRIADVMGRAAG